MHRAQGGGSVVAARPRPRSVAADEPGAQVRGSTWLLVGQMLGIAINLAAQILVIRYLTKDSFGAFAFALAIVAVGEVVATFGLRRAVSRFVPIYLEHGDRRSAAGVLVFATAGVAMLGLLLALVLVAFREPISDDVGGTHAAAVLAVLAFIIPVTALENLFDAIFGMFHKARLIALRSYVYIPLARMLVVLALIVTGSGVVVLAAGYVIAGAVGVARVRVHAAPRAGRERPARADRPSSLGVPHRAARALLGADLHPGSRVRAHLRRADPRARGGGGREGRRRSPHGRSPSH